MNNPFAELTHVVWESAEDEFPYYEDEDGEPVGHEVVAALDAAGFATTWDGSVRERIQVTGLDWKQRVPVRA